MSAEPSAADPVARAYAGRTTCIERGCPPVARLRPSEGWAYRDALLRAPPKDADEARVRQFCACHRNKKSLLLSFGVPAAMFAYGVIFWGYGQGDFGNENERWFGRDTKHGGADKAGHFTAGTIWTAAISAVHRRWGFTRNEAAKRGALSAFGTLAAIELADGTSDRHGFSSSDLAADAVGCLMGYLHETSPWVHRVIDFRWEWFPRVEPTRNTDLTSDYENSSYVVAFNVGGLLSRRPSGWDLLDLQLGYKTRGFSVEPRTKERWIFGGAGLNVSNLLRRVGFRQAAFFDYFQLPYVSLRVGYEFESGDVKFMWEP